MISIAIPTFERVDMLFETFAQVQDDDRISEIVIVDDHSQGSIQESISLASKNLSKIKFYVNQHNVGCYHNKRLAVYYCTNPYIFLWDSDNIFPIDYLNTVWDLRASWDPNVLFQPEFAKPHFDFRKYSDELIWARNVGKFVNDPTFTTMLNAMNYFVNREEYLRTFEDRPEPWTADSLLQNYNWLARGNGIYVTPGLQYEHRVHNGSHYKEHHRKTGTLYNDIIEKLKLL